VRYRIGAHREGRPRFGPHQRPDLEWLVRQLLECTYSDDAASHSQGPSGSSANPEGRNGSDLVAAADPSIRSEDEFAFVSDHSIWCKVESTSASDPDIRSEDEFAFVSDLRV